MPKAVECTCGFVIIEETEDQLVNKTLEHCTEVHDWPGMTREEILALATPVND